MPNKPYMPPSELHDYVSDNWGHTWVFTGRWESAGHISKYFYKCSSCSLEAYFEINYAPPSAKFTWFKNEKLSCDEVIMRDILQ